ncbi:alpha/beta-hydrolase [Lactarius tabidus]
MTMRLTHTLTLVVLLCGVLVAETVAVRVDSGTLHTKRLEGVKRLDHSARSPSPGGEARAADTAAPPRVKNITFTNQKASQFFVDGTTIPEVNFDIGPSWAGLLPISGAVNESRKLFFWFFPPGPQGSTDDLILWLSGGPGCSSLYGLLKENGQNEWSWTNLSSVLYVEQPVGTGFSQGLPNAKDENDVATQLVGFVQQFLEIFSEMKGKQFYIAGEGYAAIFVSYTANFIFENTTRSSLDLDLQGCWINNGQLGYDVVQTEVPAVDFVHKYEHVFAFNQTFIAELDSVAETCNYADYMAKYVTYPPEGLLPLPGESTEYDPGCDIWSMIIEATLLINPSFNIYYIFGTNLQWDVLGLPGWFPSAQTNPVYFDRADVKAAIHAPQDVHWEACPSQNSSDVFPNGDSSLPPTFTVLPNIIEKINRTVIVQGSLDSYFIAEGTRAVLQKLYSTYPYFQGGGKQGFQHAIVQDSFIVDGLPLAGLEVPENAPQASFQIMQYLLGFRDSP